MTSVLSPNASTHYQPKPALTTSHPFTCNTCQVAFRSHDSQRTHYHTDWHQYNLKRKVASLPPLSSEIFAEKVLHAQANTRLERERATFEKACKACNKTYYSENAYANHVGSQKHRQNIATQQMNAIRAGGSVRNIPTGIAGGQAVDEKDEKDETASISSKFSLGDPISEEGPMAPYPTPAAGTEQKQPLDKIKDLNISKDSPSSSSESLPEAPQPAAESQLLPLEACLFCPYLSPSLTLNVCHMTKAHGLFIPEASYLVDLAGLVTYLGKKLVLGNQCLYCSKTKGGLEGIRTHMQDKGHTMLGFETEEQQIELGQYYNFESTYSDAGEESISSDEASKPKRKGRALDDDDEGWKVVDGEGEGWETDSSASSLDSLELGSVPVDRNHEHHSGDKHRHHKPDGFHSHAHRSGILYHDDYELHLPSGRSVGHRSLAKYYRQNLRDHPLQDKSVRRIADTPYPRDAGVEADDEEEADNEEGGVEVSENEERALNRRERREEQRIAKREVLGVAPAQQRTVGVMSQRARDEELRGRRRQEWGVNKKGNSQKHFRDPLLQ